MRVRLHSWVDLHDADPSLDPDFDNAGLADPSQELAVVLVEYGAEPGRAGLIRAAYAEAGGPGSASSSTSR